MSGIFIQYGVSSSGLIKTTLAPTIDTLVCVDDSGTITIEFDVTNNDLLTADIEVSLSPSFTSSSTLSVASTENGSFSLSSPSNPPGSTTVYARALASGKSISPTTSRTQTLSVCALI